MGARGVRHCLMMLPKISCSVAMSTPLVLVVEDDRAISDVLVYNLEQAGYRVRVSGDGRDGLQQAQIHLPDLIVLDLMLPVVDGLEVCRQLRASPMTRDILIVMLTAKSEEFDEVVGLSLGADDYISKPFSTRIFLERVKSLLRRRDAKTADHDVISRHGITVDRRSFQATAGQAVLDLTLSEFGLLNVMIRQAGRAFSRNELIDTALGKDTLVLERTVDVHIRSLRQKLGDYGELIETVRGIGYRFRERRETD